MPRRIQRLRVKNWRKPPGAIYVGRPSRWGNPFRVGDEYKPSHVSLVTTLTLENCLQVHEQYARDRRDEDAGWLEPLRDQDLMCWCSLTSPCHADVLLKLANETTTN